MKVQCDTEEFDDLRRLAEKATPGPWTAEAGGSEGYYIFGQRGEDGSHPLRRRRVASVTWGSFEQDKANAKYIEACVNFVQEMLAKLV